MKYLNKFIAAGLGFALLFTGTNFAHAWFTSRAEQKNVITIQKPKIEVILGKQAYFADKYEGRFTRLYIPIKISGDIDIDNLIVKPEISGFKRDYKYEIGKGENSSLTYIIITPVTPVNTNDKDGFPTSTSFNLNLKITVKNTQYELLNQLYNVVKSDNGNPDNNKIQYVSISVSKPASMTELEITQEELPINEEIQQQPEQDVENTIETEVIEQSKEEVVEPSEVEVIEPSGEEIIKQPEVVEPPKETEDLQE